jgi:hypothetical protein
VYGVHQTVERALNLIFPASTRDYWLNWWLHWLGESDGSGGYGLIIPRISSATDGLRVTYTGSPGAILNKELTDTAGRRYKATEELTGGGSPEDVDVESIDTGLAVNLESGTILTFVNPPANVDEDATLVLDLDGGADAETNAEGRLRLLKRLQNPPLSANPAQVRQVAENAAPGALRCYVYPKRQFQAAGFGCVDIAATQIGETGTDRPASAAQRTLIEAAVEANLPVQLWRNYRVLTINTVTQQIILTYTLSPSAAEAKKCDWDAEDLQTDVDQANCNEGTKQIAANDNVHLHLTTGDRCIIDGQEVTVDDVGTGGGLGSDKYFTITTWPWGTGVDPADGAYIMSGGGIVSDIIQGIKDYFDTFGPARGEPYVDQTDQWTDAITTLYLQKTVIDVDDNVIDVVVTTPASDTALVGDTDSAVDLQIYGEIVVWEDK